MAGLTEAFIKDFVEDRQGAYAPLHKQVKANRALRFGLNAPKIPKVYEGTTTVVRSPVAADILLRVVATLSTDDPVITCPPMSKHKKAKDNASLRERWTQASLERMSRDAGRDILRMMLDAAVSDGLGIGKLIERKNAWFGFPERGEDEATKYLDRIDKFSKSQPFPFVWTDVNPLTYLPDQTAYGISQVAEVTKRPAVPTMQEFGIWRDASRKFRNNRHPGEPMDDDDDYVGETWDCVEYHNGKTVAYMLDGELVDQRTINYPRPPYFAMGGHMTSSREPDQMYHSVIQPFAHLLPALDSMLTMMSNLTYFFGYPYLVKDDPTKGIMAGPSNPTQITKIKPGTVLENVKFLVPDIPQLIPDMINLYNVMIDRSGLAAVMYGQGASSSSGYMVAQLMTAAQLVYSPIVKNARMALEQMIEFMWRLIETTMLPYKGGQSKIFVWGKGSAKGQSEWLGLGPEDIDGYYAVEVKLKPLLPIDEIQQGQFAASMANGGIWSKEHARIHTGIEQPEEEAEQIATEELMESPEIRGPLARQAAERRGLLPPPPVAPPSGLVDQFGQPLPMPGGAPQGLGGFGAVVPPAGLVPGQGLPLVPPLPAGAGMMPNTGGNLGPPQGMV